MISGTSFNLYRSLGMIFSQLPWKRNTTAGVMLSFVTHCCCLVSVYPQDEMIEHDCDWKKSKDWTVTLQMVSFCMYFILLLEGRAGLNRTNRHNLKSDICTRCFLINFWSECFHFQFHFTHPQLLILVCARGPVFLMRGSQSETELQSTPHVRAGEPFVWTRLNHSESPVQPWQVLLYIHVSCITYNSVFVARLWTVLLSLHSVWMM